MQTYPLYMESTDKKPIIVDNFFGGYNKALRLLHHSVQPKNGVVKFDFSSWDLFPKTIRLAKELAVKWSDSFERRKDFINKSVVIFFHLTFKTIRIEIKEKQKFIFEQSNCVVGFSNDDVSHKIKDREIDEINQNKIIIEE
jgi:hypothetical protein